MVQDDKKPNILDRPVARLGAILVIGACVALLGYHHRDDLFPAPGTGNAGLNPDFVQCRDKRTADIDKMKSDGVITSAQYNQFLQRAMAFCTTQFPPEGK